MGAVRYGVTFWLYRGFPAPKAPSTVLVVAPGRARVLRVVPATTQRILVRTSALNGWADPVYVVLPPGYTQHPWVRYPVLYLLHGFPGEPLNFFTAGDLVSTYEVLVAEQRVQPMILVVPSGSKHFLTDEEWANGVRPHNAWETFVARSLVATIDARYRTITSGRSRAIAGLSEGGYASLNIGFHHPGEFDVFEIATLAAFLAVIREILHEPGWAWAGPVLAFPAIFWTLGLGQNAFLTAALFGGFTLLIDRRPGMAGMLLGLLCYKPHFGLLAPAGLACGGHWRAFFAAAGTVAGLVLLSVAVFGVETWQAYLTAFAGSDAVYASGRIDYAGIVTPFGAARLLGFNPAAS